MNIPGLGRKVNVLGSGQAMGHAHHRFHRCTGGHRSRVPGVGSQVPGLRSRVSGPRCQVFRSQVPGVRCRGILDGGLSRGAMGHGVSHCLSRSQRSKKCDIPLRPVTGDGRRKSTATQQGTPPEVVFSLISVDHVFARVGQLPEGQPPRFLFSPSPDTRHPGPET